MTAWQTLTVDDALAELETTRKGLDSNEVAERQERYGSNELKQTDPPTALQVWINQFKSPMIGFLAACAVITGIQQEWVDTIAIAAILLLNAVVGFWQERKAESDVRALASLSSPTARVIREGDSSELDAKELVPGDIVALESGDRVPADLRLITTKGLRVDESMLTGEVLPVDKNTDTTEEDLPPAEQRNMVFSGTLIVTGRAEGLVTATGAETELGAINELVQGAAKKTPLQILADKLEKTIGIVVLGVAVAIGVAGVAIGTSISEMFRTVVALIVSAMPEALPIVLTVAMGYGVSQMAKHQAVVRRLPSVETLGSTTVIGSDKTGTLTQNRLTVETLWTPGEGSSDLDELSDTQKYMLRAGALTNEAKPSNESASGYLGDAVDVAMLSAAADAGAVEPADRPEILAEMAYEPELGYSQTIRSTDDSPVLYVKGAPEKISEFATQMATPDGDHDLDIDAITEANDAMAADGLRVIAVAAKRIDDVPEGDELPTPEGMVFLGMQGMVDPPREGVPEAVQQCREAGIHVMMITGDNPKTAVAIGERLGLDTSHKPITGSEMSDLDDDALLGRLEKTSIAARMTPQDKLRIVEILQDQDEIVAVTGDGVNDAPALRAASIGVAMGESGTDVAREASDVVLTDDNFVTIVQAVRQGRVTFSTIRKATFFLLSSALGTMVAVAVNTFSHHPLIFLPVMILWMNIVMNGLQDVALSFEPGDGDELEQKPRKRGEGILDGTMWMRTIMTGLIMAVTTLVVYDRALEAGIGLDQARTMALTTMVMSNFFQVLNARTERASIFTVNPLRNPFLGIAAVGALILHWGAMSIAPVAAVFGFVGLSATQWAICLGLGAIQLVVVEVEKAIRRAIKK